MGGVGGVGRGGGGASLHRPDYVKYVHVTQFKMLLFW